jgi:hypothetical protein
MTTNIKLRSKSNTTDALFTYTKSTSILTKAEVDDNFTNITAALVTLNTKVLSSLTEGSPSGTVNMLIYSGSTWASKQMTGDASITSSGAITVTKINSVAVSLVGALTTTGGSSSLTIALGGNTSITLPTSGTLLANALTSAYVFVGSAGGVATGVAITGVIALTNAGVTSYVAGSIGKDDINASAGIELTKLATLGATSYALRNTTGGVIEVSTTTAAELAFLAGATAATVVASKAVVCGTTKEIDTLTIGGLVIASNTIATLSSGNIILDPNGTGVISLAANLISSGITWTVTGSLGITTTDNIVIDTANNKTITIQSTTVGNKASITIGRSTDWIGYFGAPPVGLQTTLGRTAAATPGDSGAVWCNTKWTGGVGATEYSVADLVAILKLYGLLTS